MVVDINIPKEAFLKKYQHLIYNNADIDFYYGGRDSGKSQDICQQLIVDCLSLPYFRCMLIRKTFANVKDSQWQTLKDTIERWGLADLFVFKVAPLSIECINGNSFLARGCDDPQNIKSTKDPSHAWIEEGNQLTLEDFIVIITTLRNNQVKCKTRFSFNPECEGDYKDFWLFKTFFKEHAPDGSPLNGRFFWELDLNAGDSSMEVNSAGKLVQVLEYTVTHSTYHDNPYCAPVRKVFLEQLKKIDPYFYKIYTLGLWGNRKVGDPFCYAFDYDNHVKAHLPTRREPLYLSFDFNVNPITCGVYQHKGKHIRGLRSIKLENSDIYKLCAFIKVNYPGFVYFVTGDATGSNTSALVQDGINYYTVIKSKLRLSSNQIKVPTINPDIKDNRVLINVIFNSYNVSFHPEFCKELIYDCQNVTVDDVGKIDKGDRKNPKKRADHLDHYRYYLNTFHKSALKSI